jgi:hypothetical protein
MKYRATLLSEARQARRERRAGLEGFAVEKPLLARESQALMLLKEYAEHYAKPRGDVTTWFEIQRVRRAATRCNERMETAIKASAYGHEPT